MTGLAPSFYRVPQATSSNANDGERCNDRHDQGPSSPHVPLHPSSPSSLSKPSPLHFIYLGLWGSKTPPATFAANFKRFQEQNTERKVVLWTDAMVEELVQTHLTKEQLLLYRISAPIQKADIARYLVVLIHGGWYLDLDVGVDCVADHQERTQSKEGIAAACTNVVANLEKAAGLQPHRATHPSVPVTAALFWEHRPLTYQEQMETALRPCREGLPEHRIRLANYGFWCTAGCLALQRILHLSFMRLQRFQHKPGNAGRQCDVRALDLQRGKEYTVLYSTGPDVCTEAVFGARDPGNDNAPGIAQLLFPFSGYNKPPSPMQSIQQQHRHHRHQHAHRNDDIFQGILGDGTLYMDPHDLLVNTNAFTWRGKHNVALQRDW